MAWLRRSVVAVLGAILVVDALVGKRLLVFQFAIGLIPIDYVVGLLARSDDDAADQEAELERLREVMRRHDTQDGSEGGETD